MIGSLDVSVVIPTYHREDQVTEAIRSVLCQRDVSFEVVVVDDSPEGSARAGVEGLGDDRVRYLLRTSPSGGRPARVRNDGARLARGRFIHFLDDDDIFVEGALARLVRALDSDPSKSMAFGVVIPFGNDAKVLRHHELFYAQARVRALRLTSARQLAAVQVFRPTVLINSACMARRSVFDAVGGFDVEIPICEDADLWARVAQAGGFVYVDAPVVRYRTGAPSLMHNLAQNDEKLHVSYRRMQKTFRERNGILQYYLLKLWARGLAR